jgi:hypothetical protein
MNRNLRNFPPRVDKQDAEPSHPLARAARGGSLVVCLAPFVVIASLTLIWPAQAEDFRPVKLRSTITKVQPMTGLVMWESSKNSRSDAIQLEYSYMRYNDVVLRKGEYDWSAVEQKLKPIAARKHQAVLRFYETWPGRKTTVPGYIKDLPEVPGQHIEFEADLNFRKTSTKGCKP